MFNYSINLKMITLAKQAQAEQKYVTNFMGKTE